VLTRQNSVGATSGDVRGCGGRTYVLRGEGGGGGKDQLAGRVRSEGRACKCEMKDESGGYFLRGEIGKGRRGS
jgi:hypothetical protein